MDSYRVTGKYVTVRTMTTDGPKILGLHEGAPLPSDVSPATIEHLVSHNLAEKIPVAAAEPERDDRAEVEAAAKAAAEAAEAAAKAEAEAKAPQADASDEGLSPQQRGAKTRAANKAKEE